MLQVLYLPLQYHTDKFTALNNPLYFTYSALPTSNLLATPDVGTVSIALPFPECHMIGFLQYVAFSYWLL